MSKIVSYRMSDKHASGEELNDQLKFFIEIATKSGYVITKKVIYTDGEGYNVVEVEGEK